MCGRGRGTWRVHVGHARPVLITALCVLIGLAAPKGGLVEVCGACGFALLLTTLPQVLRRRTKQQYKHTVIEDFADNTRHVITIDVPLPKTPLTLAHAVARQLQVPFRHVGVTYSSTLLSCCDIYAPLPGGTGSSPATKNRTDAQDADAADSNSTSNAATAAVSAERLQLQDMESLVNTLGRLAKKADDASQEKIDRLKEETARVECDRAKLTAQFVNVDSLREQAKKTSRLLSWSDNE